MKSVRSVALLARTALIVAVTGAALFVVAFLAGLRVPNPFSTTQVTHDHDVVLQQLTDLHRYTAANQHLQTVIDVENHPDHVPSGLLGEREVFVAEGDVSASVDMSKLASSGIQVSADNTSVTVHLPEPTVDTPSLDVHKSAVVARDRGVLDRIGDAVSGSNPSNDQHLYELAQEKLTASANDGPLQDTARANTETFVHDLFTKVGYTHVTVVFDQPAANQAA